MQLCMLSCIYIMWVLQGSAEITLYLCVCIFCSHDSQVCRPHREHLADRQYAKRAWQFAWFRFTYLRQHKHAVYGDRVISRTYVFIYWPYPASQLQQNTSRLHSSYFKTTRQKHCRNTSNFMRLQVLRMKTEISRDTYTPINVSHRQRDTLILKERSSPWVYAVGVECTEIINKQLFLWAVWASSS